MKTLKKIGVILLLALSGVTSSCSDDDDKNETAYECLTCVDTPDALAVNDNSIKGVYKGIVVGSTGTISINIQNGSSTITATMVLDDDTILLTSTVEVVEGQTYIAPFTGTYNGSPISITFSVGLSGANPTVVTSSIPGHPNAVFQVFKETSTALIEAFEGTYTKTGETGVFNIVLSSALGGFSGISKDNQTNETNDVDGDYNANGDLIDENGTVLGTVTGDELDGNFIDGNGDQVVITGYRTL